MTWFISMLLAFIMNAHSAPPNKGPPIFHDTGCMKTTQCPPLKG